MAMELGFQRTAFDKIIKELESDSFPSGLVNFYETALVLASSEGDNKEETMGGEHIFISYAREDMAAAKKLHMELKKANLNPWLDIHNLPPGIKWRPGIETALRNSSHCLLLLSTSSVTKKGYVQKETKIALDIVGENPETKAFLIPIRLEECSPSHHDLTELNWVDLFPFWDEGLSRIISTIKGEEYKGKHKYKFGDLLFGLGNHIAMLGWVSITKENKLEMDNVFNRTVTIIKTIEMPSNIEAVLVEFYKNKKQMDSSGDPTKSAERMLHIRNLLSMTIENRLDISSEKIFSLGFVLTNVIYMCERPEIVMTTKAFIIENLEFAEKVSIELCLTPNVLADIILKAQTANDLKESAELYTALTSSLTNIEKMLRN